MAGPMPIKSKMGRSEKLTSICPEFSPPVDMQRVFQGEGKSQEPGRLPEAPRAPAGGGRPKGVPGLDNPGL